MKDISEMLKSSIKRKCTCSIAIQRIS